MQTQYNVLSYEIDLYFHDYQLPIKIDENVHSNKNIDYKIKREKAIESNNLFVNLLELILKKKTLMFLKLPMEYLGTLKNRIRKL